MSEIIHGIGEGVVAILAGSAILWLLMTLFPGGRKK